jgi:hypothetical protein
MRLLKPALTTSIQANEARDCFCDRHHKARGLGLIAYVQRSRFGGSGVLAMMDGLGHSRITWDSNIRHVLAFHDLLFDSHVP